MQKAGLYKLDPSSSLLYGPGFLPGFSTVFTNAFQGSVRFLEILYPPRAIYKHCRLRAKSNHFFHVFVSGGPLFRKLYVIVFGLALGPLWVQGQTSGKRMTEFDGDGKKDISVFRPSNGTWYIQGSSSGYFDYQWGLPGDIPVPGDYNGYGRASAAIYRPSNGYWFISPVGGSPYSVQFGVPGDIPVPGD